MTTVDVSSAFGHGASNVAPGEPLLEVRDVVKYFPIEQGILFKKQIGEVKAVDGVSFTLHKGETLGLVGESGCGKSTLSKTLLRLHEPTGGEAVYNGADIFDLDKTQLRRMRRDIQIIFQDPYASLNPRMTVADIVGEPLQIHPEVVARDKRRTYVRDLLERVGLNPDFENRYPHQFSGGQRQRIGVARALALNPSIIICDEPVSALDVSVQAQVMNLLDDIQEEFGLSFIFIAHDLSVVRHICDRVAVMYLGKIAELGDEHHIYDRPTHPYTQALLSALPIPDPRSRDRKDRIVLTGDVPSPANPPSGCRFRTRCWKAEEKCALEEPALIDRGHGHPSACHFAAPRDVLAVGEEDIPSSAPEDTTPTEEGQMDAPEPAASHAEAAAASAPQPAAGGRPQRSFSSDRNWQSITNMARAALFAGVLALIIRFYSTRIVDGVCSSTDFAGLTLGPLAIILAVIALVQKPDDRTKNPSFSRTIALIAIPLGVIGLLRGLGIIWSNCP